MAEEVGLFEIKDESKLNEATPLVNEPYTYENMVNNPIIKPIAECDRSLRDLEEMEYKKLIDIKRLKEKVNVVIGDVPSYQDSSFIADLIKLTQSMDDVIKLQDIMLGITKGCIKNVHKDVNDRYGVRLADKDEYVEPEIVIPEGSVSAYLDKLCSNNDEKICQIGQGIKDLFLKPTIKGKDEKEKFDNAAAEYYGKEVDKIKKKLISKVIRMEIQ